MTEKNRYKVVAIFGPTAVGKTELAVRLADLLRKRNEHPVAVSADALQIYQGLERLTGVASNEQQAKLEHRLISCVPVDRSFSVGEYAQLAHREIDGLIESGAIPIVVGGTGLYLRAAIAQLSLAPPVDRQIRIRLQRELAEVGLEALHRRLAELDPPTAERISPTDKQRVLRGLELAEAGVAVPSRRSEELWTKQTRHPTLLVGLELERGSLYRRIEQRVDDILAAGALEEVHAAVAAGASSTARKALGFEELLVGDIAGMKRRSRNLAKRQLTWMRKLAEVHRVDLTELDPETAARQIFDLYGVS